MSIKSVDLRKQAAETHAQAGRLAGPEGSRRARFGERRGILYMYSSISSKLYIVKKITSALKVAWHVRHLLGFRYEIELNRRAGTP